MKLSFNAIRMAQITAALLVLSTGLLWAPAVWGHGGSHGANTPHPAPAAARPTNLAGTGARFDPSFQAPHKGQLSKTLVNYIEVVYGPQETHVYVYDMYRAPQSARGIQGQALMRVRSTGREYRYPLQYVPAPDGQDYLSIAVDLTRVLDGDMEVDYELADLPSEIRSTANFTQTFTLHRPPVQVTVAPLKEADRPLVEEQRICPVMDAGLSEHGQPIKLMIGNISLFVCCEGCVEAVEKNPQQYLQKMAAIWEANHQPPRPQVAVFWAAASDDAAIRAQGNCPVMNQPLGAHGRPLKVVIDGRPLFVCCEGCIDKAVQNRDFFFSGAAGTAVGTPTEPPPSQPAPPQRNITVNYAAAADQPAIQAQRVCPVMNQPLGEHGIPIKIIVDGQPVFVCCQGCVGQVQQNPEQYLLKRPYEPQSDRSRSSVDDVYRQSIKKAGGSCCSSKGCH